MSFVIFLLWYFDPRKLILMPNNIQEKISPFCLVKSSAKRGNKPSILIRQGSKKLTDGQSNLLLSNQEHALDGAMDGTIFP